MDEILFNGKKNVIWGTGYEGIRLLKEMIKQKIYIDFFCDSNIEKQKIYIWNKKVMSPEELIRNKEHYNVIVGVKNPLFVKEILNTLIENDVKDIILGSDISNTDGDFGLSATRIWRFVQTAKQKKYIIWGCNQQAKQIIQIAQMLDIGIEFIVEKNPAHDTFCGIEVRDVYDIGYEYIDRYMVLVTSDEDTDFNFTILNEIGLSEKKHFDCWDYFTTENYITYALDPNMGYTYLNSQFEECPGITLFGSRNAKKCIAILGGSTSDATRFPFKSWAELLYERLSEKNNVCILCAGCSGYNSSQEMIKLIRDIIPYYPDIVISYSGVNDRIHFSWKQELKTYPFINPYQYDMTILEAQRLQYRRISGSKDAYSFGLKQEDGQYDRFKMNMHMMKAICESYGITFIGILQPYIGSGKNYTMDTYELIVNTQLEKSIEWSTPFYDLAIQEAGKKYEDFTKIFKDVEDIWIDDCHVTEKGNAIIAEKVYELMKERKCIF